MFLRKKNTGVNGHRVVGALPHNPKANDLYSTKVLNERVRLQSLVEELLKNKKLDAIINGFEVEFRISGRILFTIYKFKNSQTNYETHNFKSIFANNGPEDELLLALAKAECNTQLATDNSQLILYSYPAVGFLISEKESKTVRNRLRKLAKNPYLLRFR